MLFEPNTNDGKEVATYETIVSNSTRQKDPSLVWTDFKFNVITLINAKCLYIHRDLAGACYYYGWNSFIYATTLRPYDWLSNKPTGSPTLAASIFWSMKKLWLHPDIWIWLLMSECEALFSVYHLFRRSFRWRVFRTESKYRDFTVSTMEKRRSP